MLGEDVDRQPAESEARVLGHPLVPLESVLLGRRLREEASPLRPEPERIGDRRLAAVSLAHQGLRQGAHLEPHPDPTVLRIEVSVRRVVRGEPDRVLDPVEHLVQKQAVPLV